MMVLIYCSKKIIYLLEAGENPGKKRNRDSDKRLLNKSVYYRKSVVVLKVLYNGKGWILEGSITSTDDFIPKEFLPNRLNFDFVLNPFALNLVWRLCR